MLDATEGAVIWDFGQVIFLRSWPGVKEKWIKVRRRCAGGGVPGPRVRVHAARTGPLPQPGVAVAARPLGACPRQHGYFGPDTPQTVKIGRLSRSISLSRES